MSNQWDYRNPWDPRNLQITFPPNQFNKFDQYFWNQVKYTPNEAVEAGILDYTHGDFVKCLTQDFCVLPLVLSGLAFAYLATFVITLSVLYFVGVVYGLASKLFCTFYQMSYFVSSDRWKVDETQLDQLRKDILLSRDVANQRFQALDEDKVQINRLLNNFGL
uniref:Uncharacterized protein n=1 Tax=Panagrolaimus sp. JU765 TaxID=591449 RepID=A0AC34R5Z4_9BILA